MSPILIITYFSLSSFLAYLFSLTTFVSYLPQLIALLSLVAILISHKSYFIYIISIIINLIVFSTGGATSPVFFLIYFLLLVIAFENTPVIPLAYSLVLIILLAQSLNSFVSLVTLSSLTLISPLSWFIGQNRQQIVADETNFFMWLSLKFKTSITKIIDSSSILLSKPDLSNYDKEQLHSIKSSAKNLLNSANHFLDPSSDDEN